MADQEIKEIREEYHELTKAVARIETLLTESVIKELDTIRKRLDRHSDRLDALERTQHQAITIKEMIVWICGTALTAIGVAISVAKMIVGA